MLSKMIAWVTSLFFLFMASRSVYVMFTVTGADGGMYIAFLTWIVIFASAAWGTAKLGGL